MWTGESGEVGVQWVERACACCVPLHSRGLYGVSVQSRVTLLASSVGGLMAYGAVREPRRTRRREVEVNSEGA